MFSVPNDIKRPIRCNKLNLSSFHDSVNVMLYTWDEGWQQTEPIRWGRDCVFSCRLRLWQYAKNFKPTLETEGTRMSLTSFVRLLYISITPLSLNFYPISVTTSSEEGGRKKRRSGVKISSVYIKTCRVTKAVRKQGPRLVLASVLHAGTASRWR